MGSCGTRGLSRDRFPEILPRALGHIPVLRANVDWNTDPVRDANHHGWKSMNWKTMSKWHPIETAPKNQRVLVCGGDIPDGMVFIAVNDPSRHVPSGQCPDSAWYMDKGGRHIYPYPTHWQPLPMAISSWDAVKKQYKEGRLNRPYWGISSE